MSENLQIRLAARPEGLPKSSDFETTREPIPTPADGQALVRVVYLSLDPAMRGWMTDRKSYIEPIQLGAIMRGLAVGEVMESKDDSLKPGDRVSGALGWQQYVAIDAREVQKLPAGPPWPLFLGPLGMTGLTAYFGLLDIGQPKEGETVLVSGGAGAVGSMVGQLAKIHGCRAVGLAGSDDKCQWMVDELGYDAAINYKTAELDVEVKAACPDGVDIYFDNVGGEILDLALRFINQGARIPICGAISQYNATEPSPGPSNYLSLLINRARMEGFIVFDYRRRYGEGLEALGRWVAEGKIQARYDVIEGLENASAALNRLFDGSNTGKLMVQIGPEELSE